MFLTSIIPEGWKKTTHKHKNYIKLLDNLDNWRATLYYDGSLDNISAKITFNTRYWFSTAVKFNTKYTVCVFNEKEYIKEICEFDRPLTDKETVKYKRLASVWLNENYPNWKDPLAYCD